jgi:hypothetical protein
VLLAQRRLRRLFHHSQHDGCFWLLLHSKRLSLGLAVLFFAPRGLSHSAAIVNTAFPKYIF